MFCRVGGVDCPSSFKTVTSSASYPNESAQTHVLAKHIDARLLHTDEEVAKIVYVLERALQSIVGMFSECLIIANPDTQRAVCHDDSGVIKVARDASLLEEVFEGEILCSADFYTVRVPSKSPSTTNAPNTF